jgi:type IV pilus assembly protein PilE
VTRVARFRGNVDIDSFVKGTTPTIAPMKPQSRPGDAPVNTLPHAQRPRDRRRTAGFTLIELMITVGIVAILTAIAYPAYRNYVLRGQVTYATNALSAMSANMERYFQDNRQYTSVTPGTAPMSPCDTAQPASTFTAGTFTLSCTTYTASTFLITASGNAGSSTAGFSYTIDYQGNQTSTVASPAPSAWRLTCTASWETRAGTC